MTDFLALAVALFVCTSAGTLCLLALFGSAQTRCVATELLLQLVHGRKRT